jgi:hypothetical protein
MKLANNKFFAIIIANNEQIVKILETNSISELVLVDAKDFIPIAQISLQ